MWILDFFPSKESRKLDLEGRAQHFIYRLRSKKNQFLDDAIMGKRVLTAYEWALEEGVGIGKIEGKLEGRLEGEFLKAIETAQRRN